MRGGDGVKRLDGRLNLGDRGVVQLLGVLKFFIQRRLLIVDEPKEPETNQSWTII